MYKHRKLVKKNFSRGATLIELMIVMLVFLILASLGIAVINEYKKGAEFRSAGLQFENTIDSVRNMARNNVVSRVQSEDPTDNTPNMATGRDYFNSQINGYLLSIEDETFSVYSCKIPIDSAIHDYDCTREPSLFKPGDYDVIFEDPAGCIGVFFKSLSGDMVFGSEFNSGQLSISNSPDNCNVTYRYRGSTELNRCKIYIFNQKTNEVEITECPA